MWQVTSTCTGANSNSSGLSTPEPTATPLDTTHQTGPARHHRGGGSDGKGSAQAPAGSTSQALPPTAGPKVKDGACSSGPPRGRGVVEGVSERVPSESLLEEMQLGWSSHSHAMP